MRFMDFVLPTTDCRTKTRSNLERLGDFGYGNKYVPRKVLATSFRAQTKGRIVSCITLK